mgnify:CR=1 FL=1
MDKQRAKGISSNPTINLLVSGLIKKAKRKRLELFDELIKNPSGDKWCKAYTNLADRIVRGTYRIATREMNAAPNIAVVAVGGYGRKELAPYSDLDITFIPQDDLDPDNEESVRLLYRLLIEVFHQLDWPIGYAYRLRSDCPGLDADTRTGLLDARLICGKENALLSFSKYFYKTFPHAEFLYSKINERSENRIKYYNSPRIIEFHLRDGVGGLRDFQTSIWISKSLNLKLAKIPYQQYELLLKIRNIAHSVSGKKQDVLVRTKQNLVSKALNVKSEKLHEMVISSAEVVNDFWKQTKKLALKSSFPLSDHVNAKNGKCFFKKELTLSDAFTGIGRAQKLGIYTHKRKWDLPIGDAPKAVEWLVSGYEVMRCLFECGLLEALIPEFSKCRYLTSDDPVHIYTVAEHSLKVVSNLEELKNNDKYQHVWSEISNARPLFLSALLHDIGKSDTRKSHSESGAILVEKICKRLGVLDDDLRTTVWLVMEHLSFARFARTHDIANPKTAHALAKLCERRDRLAMLYLLTIADTSAVSNDALTPQMLSFMGELYERATSLIGTEEMNLDDALFQRQTKKQLEIRGHINEHVEEMINIMPSNYFLATPLDLLPLHAEYVRKAKQGEITVEYNHKPDASLTEVTICMKDIDKPGLLSRILAIIYALDISLHSARVSSTSGESPVALDVLSLTFFDKPLPLSLCKLLSNELKARLQDETLVNDFLRSHGKDPFRKQSLLSYKFIEGKPAVLEIETPLGRGMPYRVTKMLAQFGWAVQFARIGQWAGKAVARFHLEKKNRLPITAKEVERRLGKAER